MQCSLPPITERSTYKRNKRRNIQEGGIGPIPYKFRPLTNYDTNRIPSVWQSEKSKGKVLAVNWEKKRDKKRENKESNSFPDMKQLEIEEDVFHNMKSLLNDSIDFKPPFNENNRLEFFENCRKI